MLRHPMAPWLAGAFLLLLVFHLALAFHLPGPILYEDTMGYLAVARALAGWEPPPVLNAPNGFYHFGYPLMLAPLYPLLGSTERVFQGALVLDSLLASLQVLVLYALGRGLFGLERGFALGAALAAALYPAWLLQSSFAWSESLFATVFSLWVLLAWRSLRPDGGPWLLAFGLAGAFLYAIHPRGLGLVAVTLAALGLAALRGWAGRRWTVMALAVTGAAFATTRMLNAFFLENLWLTRPRGQEGNVLRLLLDPAVWAGSMPARVAGQVWYLLAATLGLAAVGALVLALQARGTSADPNHPVRARVAGLVLGAAVAVLFASATVMLPAVRSDHLVYGRYNEALLGPFLLAGLTGLSVPRRTRLLRLAGAAALLAGLGLSLARLLPEEILATQPMPLNVLGVLLWNPWMFFDVERTTALALAASLVFALAALASRRAALVALAGFFAVSAALITERQLLPFCRFWRSFATLQDTLRPLAPASVSYERSGLAGTFGFNAYQFWLDRTRFRLFDSAAGEAPSDPLVIASRAWGSGRPGYRKAAAEMRTDQVLWVAPGPLQAELESRGLLFPDNSTARLPPEAVRSRIERLDGAGEIESRAGEALTLRFRLTHAGRGAPWLPIGVAAAPLGSIRLGARWFRPGAVHAVEPGGFRGDLPRVLRPGESAEAEITVTAVGNGGKPLEPGRYELEIGLLQEGFQWFAETGDQPLRIPVEILPPRRSFVLTGYSPDSAGS